MSIGQYPSVDYLCQCFWYEDGRLFWLNRPRGHFITEHAYLAWHGHYAGKEAGCLVKRKGSGGKVHYRWEVHVNGWNFFRYTVVWAIFNGVIVKRLDHENRDPLDDHIENLRIATPSQNGANANLSSNNRSGIKGVSWDSMREKWHASIKVDHKSISLGRFVDKEEARQAYVEASRRFFGKFSSV